MVRIFRFPQARKPEKESGIEKFNAETDEHVRLLMSELAMRVAQKGWAYPNEKTLQNQAEEILKEHTLATESVVQVLLARTIDSFVSRDEIKSFLVWRQIAINLGIINH